MVRHRLRNALRGFLYLDSQIRDDRGRWRRVPAWRSFTGDWAAFDGLDPETREAVRRAFAARCSLAGERWLRPWSLGTALAALAFATAIVVFSPSRGLMFVLLPILMILVLADLRCRRWLSWPDVMLLRDLLLAHRVCPHCGYPLGESAPAEDGCVVCSECAGVWRLDHAWKTSSTGSPPNS